MKKLTLVKKLPQSLNQKLDFVSQKLLILVVLFLFLSFLLPGCARAAETLRFVHQDHLSSTSLVTDENGAEVSRQTYYPYGLTRSTSGTLPNERQYTGQVSDQEQTGLYYYNARYYHPLIGKFITADGVFDQINRYAYARNNPVVFSDPSGNTVPCSPLCQKYWQEQTADYPVVAKEPTNFREWWKMVSANFFNYAGLLDLLPASWGNREYVSKQAVAEAELADSLSIDLGVVGSVNDVLRVTRKFLRATEYWPELPGSKSVVHLVDEGRNIIKMLIETNPRAARQLAEAEFRNAKILEEIGVFPEVISMVTDETGRWGYKMKRIMGEEIAFSGAEFITDATAGSITEVMTKIHEAGYYLEDFQYLILTDGSGQIMVMDPEQLIPLGEWTARYLGDPGRYRYKDMLDRLRYELRNLQSIIAGQGYVDPLDFSQ